MTAVGVKDPIAGVVYQRPSVLESYVAAGALTDETLVSAFKDAVRKFPGRTALSTSDWTCTYTELDALTDRFAFGLVKQGLAPKDPVLFQLPNSKELVIAVIGCLKAGLIPICTLLAHRQAEIGYIGKQAGARAHIVPDNDPKFDFVAFSQEMKAAIPGMNLTIAVNSSSTNAVDFDGLIHNTDAAEAADQLSRIRLDAFQVALYQLSGGTTDVPKIIPRFHNEYLYTLRTVVAFHKLDEHIIAFTPNPMMHNAPMACVWGPAVFFGGEVAVAPSLDASVVGPLLATRKPNWMILPPVVLFRLKESGWYAKCDFSTARGFSVTTGAEKFSFMVGGAACWPLFGMTEGLLAYCNVDDPAEARNSTVGRPLSPLDEVKIIHPETGEEVEEGVVGELAVRGPCTIVGYFDSQERNKVAFTEDGFYRSGDLMKMRTIEGKKYLIFEGRLKDVVSRGGEKINCAEVEGFAIGHPAIGSVAIVGMPDRVYGERACAFVIPASGATVTVAELGAYLGTRGLAKFKWPERIEFVTEFPLTSSGKLSKPKLKELAARFAALEEDAPARSAAN